MGIDENTLAKRIRDLLFITSKRAVQTLADGNAAAAAELQQIKAVAGAKRWIELPGIPTASEAAKAAQQALRQLDTVRGVVVLGNYDVMPARRLVCINTSLFKDLQVTHCNPEKDRDDWWVWNDDWYGDVVGNGMPDFPVSRLPIIPERGGISGLSLPTSAPLNSVLALRAKEFVFADHIYKTSVKGKLPAGMKKVPPGGQERPQNDLEGFWTGPLVDGELSAGHLYLVAHGDNGGGVAYMGSTQTGWGNIAVEPNVIGPSRVVFGGICWGSLMVRIARRDDVEQGVPDGFIARTLDESLALCFLNAGANAYVGFTAAHYVPDGERWGHDPTALGGPLHTLFWDNVVQKEMRPAKALHVARLQFIHDAMEHKAGQTFLSAEAMKTYWSATCLGFGW